MDEIVLRIRIARWAGCAMVGGLLTACPRASTDRDAAMADAAHTMTAPEASVDAIVPRDGVLDTGVDTATDVRIPPPTNLRWDPPSTAVYDPPGRRYAYAPSVVVEGDVEHIWACANTDDGVVRDHVVYIQRRGGAVVRTAVALAPSASGWDSYHDCDPTLVAGRFVYQGSTYAYAMFYLGNDVDASRHNAIGVAFAHALTGPWVRLPSPVVPFPADDAVTEWGVGQPSATSVDGAGRVLLFYTQGDHHGTHAYVRDVDLHDAAAAVVGAPIAITTAGLTRATGGADWLDNFDMVYDPTRDRFFAVREQRPAATTTPTVIAPTLEVVSIEGASIWAGMGAWRSEGTITPTLTGFARNHNAGLARTAAGTLPDPTSIDVVFASSCACTDWLWTYDLHAIHGTL